MDIDENIIDFVWDIAQKRDITIAGQNGIAKLCNSDDKIIITLYLNGTDAEAAFYFLEIGRKGPIKNPNNLIGFMHKKSAPKEFVDHATKKGENLLWLSKNDLCLALIDIMDFIKG